MALSFFCMKSLDDVLSWKVAKRAILIGSILSLIWIGIGAFFWKEALAVTSYFLSWIPFAILKSNAAFLIGSFAWFFVVLSSYAILMSIFNILFFKRDSFKSYEYFSLILIVLTAIFWTLFAIFNWDFVYKEVAKVLAIFPFKTLEETIASLLAVLIFYNLFIFSLYLVVMVTNRAYLKEIAQKEKKDLKASSIKLPKLISYLFRDFIIFFSLLILSFPLFFVPFVNIAIQIILWAWLIKESYFISTASLYLSEDEIKSLSFQGAIKWVVSILVSILNLIPILNFFAPFFAQSIFFHWIIQKEPKTT